jgi:hypothetical protein
MLITKKEGVSKALFFVFTPKSPAIWWRLFDILIFIISPLGGNGVNQYF